MSRVHMGDCQVSRTGMGGSAGIFSGAVAVVFEGRVDCTWTWNKDL